MIAHVQFCVPTSCMNICPQCLGCRSGGFFPASVQLDCMYCIFQDIYEKWPVFHPGTTLEPVDIGWLELRWTLPYTCILRLKSGSSLHFFISPLLCGVSRDQPATASVIFCVFMLLLLPWHCLGAGWYRHVPGEDRGRTGSVRVHWLAGVHVR